MSTFFLPTHTQITGIMIRYRYLIPMVFPILLTLFTCNHSGQETSQETATDLLIADTLPWSDRMAQSIMKRHPLAWQTENDSIAEWDYKLGLLMTAFEKLYRKTKNETYAKYIEEYARTMIDSSGQISGYKLENYNIDMVNPGKFVFDLHERTQDERYLPVLHTLRRQLEGHPRTKSNGFWHKKIYPYQMWLDGLYMGTPFYARYSVTFEDGAQLDDVVHQYELIEARLRDEETGLLYHAWDESKQMDWADDETGRSPGFWARSLGWYAMALVDVLDYFPEDHPKRIQLIGYLHELADALLPFRHKSGLWYQVPDQGDREGNYLEASSSCMFVYAFAKGARLGYLPDHFRQVAEESFAGIVDQLIEVEADGEIHITNVCGSAGLGGNPYRDGTYDYYVNETIKTDNLHGTGPFILAALELDQ